MNTSRLEVDDYKKGILHGDRVILAKAITLMESTLPDDQQLAGDVLDAVMPASGNSVRIGITGSPGVGKSTFIESFGKTLISTGKRVAILTIDPSSPLTGGSILGDKTRMQELSREPNAFIRPSPSGNSLGGVAPHTRETMLLCEAAGYQIIIVETVGTGQSETAVKRMVDFFLLLVQPGSGDELQGIKKGVVEMADGIAITKADGDSLKAAKATQADFKHALHLLKPQRSGWSPRVLTCSAMTQTGMEDIRNMLEDFKNELSVSGFFETNRKDQLTSWFQEHFRFLLTIDPKRYPELSENERTLQNLIQLGKETPRGAARQLLEAYYKAVQRSRR